MMGIMTIGIIGYARKDNFLYMFIFIIAMNVMIVLNNYIDTKSLDVTLIAIAIVMAIATLYRIDKDE